MSGGARASLSAADRAAIVEHMNDDHAEALLLYARVQGGRPGAESARMLDIDADGMALAVREDGEETSLQIAFGRSLAHAGEARRTLVAMADAARRALARAPGR